MNHVREGGGAKCVCVCVCAKTEQVKAFLGECSLKVTRPDDECSKILVSNPVRVNPFELTDPINQNFPVRALRLCYYRTLHTAYYSGTSI